VTGAEPTPDHGGGVKITPMLRQYFDAKEAHPECMLFFRMGDFYELFFEDAEVAAKELELTLTARSKDKQDPIPMAGVPHHAAAGYIRRLVDRGYHVAICEQLEDPGATKGIVRRGVTRVITPGVRVDTDGIEASSHLFLTAVAVSNPKRADVTAVASVDVSTGALRVCELSTLDDVVTELRRIGPAEMLVAEGHHALFAARLDGLDVPVTVRRDEQLDLGRHVRNAEARTLDTNARTPVEASLSTSDLRDRLAALDDHTLRDRSAVDAALGLLFGYLHATRGGIPALIDAPEVYRSDDFLVLDPASAANLEIFETLMGGRKRGSLASVIDETVTGAGARRLRTWLSYPLTDVARIEDRQSAVTELVRARRLRDQIREQLDATTDIQRVAARLAAGQGNARDLVSLGRTLAIVPEVQALLGEASSSALARLRERLDPCDDVTAHILGAIVDEPPIAVTEGSIIRPGWDDELDELIELTTNGKQWLLRFEQNEKDRTGISSLKVRHNRVFGYYIEVTRANLEHVPDDYVRKQTLANAERFFTPELKEFEEKLVSAQDRRHSLEYRIFEDVRSAVIAELARIRATAEDLAELDALAGLAELSHRRRYVAPTMRSDTAIQIRDGRHPVVETMVEGERFVPNDITFDDDRRLWVITGPNMAGKSTVIRQVALIVLLAQIGSHVPAREATIGVVDQIFSRVGASDNLARGQSTFMVEMTETAHILQHATERSLVVLDEIGRGTATWDGLSIAWAVAEHLHDEIGAATLFATHYHELTDLARTRERVRNGSIAVKEYNEEILFLHKLVEGPANRSYGIQVARLAGVPEPVVQRAREVLTNLESAEFDGDEPTVGREHEDGMPVRRRAPQLSLFGEAPKAEPAARRDPIVDAIADLPLDATTPIEALNQLYRWQRQLKRRKPNRD